MKSIQIADMHWGAVNPEMYYNEMHEFIIKYLQKYAIIYLPKNIKNLSFGDFL